MVAPKSAPVTAMTAPSGKTKVPAQQRHFQGRCARVVSHQQVSQSQRHGISRTRRGNSQRSVSRATEILHRGEQARRFAPPANSCASPSSEILREKSPETSPDRRSIPTPLVCDRSGKWPRAFGRSDLHPPGVANGIHRRLPSRNSHASRRHFPARSFQSRRGNFIGKIAQVSESRRESQKVCVVGAKMQLYDFRRLQPREARPLPPGQGQTLRRSTREFPPCAVSEAGQLRRAVRTYVTSLPLRRGPRGQRQTSPSAMCRRVEHCAATAVAPSAAAATISRTRSCADNPISSPR